MSAECLGDRLSAYVDGELPAADRGGAEAHLAICERCRAEADAVAAARGAVRSLPAVEPPGRWLDDLVSQLSLAPVVPLPRRRMAMAHVAASVAASLLLLTLTTAVGRPITTAPQLAGLLDTHRSVAADQSAVGGSAGVAGSSGVEDGTGPAEAGFRAPRRLGAYQLVGMARDPDHLRLHYTDGRHHLSVFQIRGELDWSRLPRGGSRSDVDGNAAWHWSRPGSPEVLVLQRGELVRVIVGDGGRGHMEEAALDLPGPPEPSLLERVRRACEGTLEHLSVIPARRAA